MSPSDGATLGELDGIRAVAVLIIFARHAWGLTGSPGYSLGVGSWDFELSPFIVMMSNGVDLFFVLSGFLLSRKFLERHRNGEPPPAFRSYARQRVYRIYPAFWVSLVAVVFIFTPTIVPSDLVFSGRGAVIVGSHVVGLQTVFPWSYGVWGATSPFWTLTIEIIFYMTLPLLVRAFVGRRWLWGFPLLTAATFGWLAFARSEAAQPLVDLLVTHGLREGNNELFIRFYLSKQFPAHLFDFACGILAAAIYVHVRNAAEVPAKTWLRSRVFAHTLVWSGLLLVLVAMNLLGTLILSLMASS
jgi:peptidoglycan/LPS O-acetylase OafA/YrhL